MTDNKDGEQNPSQNKETGSSREQTASSDIFASYLVIGATFFVIGCIFFVIGVLVGFILKSESSDSGSSAGANRMDNSVEIAQAVEQTMTAVGEDTDNSVEIVQAVEQTMTAVGEDTDNSVEIAQAVEQTMIALTPTPQPTPTTVPVDLTYTQHDYKTGADDAPIKLVEFFDYQCGYCGRFALTTLAPLMEKYDGYVQFVYRDYVIFGDPSQLAAQAAYCADKQGNYYDYHMGIFEGLAQAERMALTQENLVNLAGEQGLDTEAFTVCLESDESKQAILDGIESARGLIGGAGTPTFLLNGRRIVGAYPLESFTVFIDEELRKLGIEPPESSS